MISYSTLSSNLKKFGPPYGASNGMKFAIKTTLFGFVGLTNAYTSVLSASGSALMSGASRWLDACSEPTPRTAAVMATAMNVHFFTTHLQDRKDCLGFLRRARARRGRTQGRAH